MRSDEERKKFPFGIEKPFIKFQLEQSLTFVLQSRTSWLEKKQQKSWIIDVF